MFGKKLKELRENKGLSLSELSRRVDVSKSYISRLEAGKNDNPSADIINKMCKALGVSTEYFYTDNASVQEHKKNELRNIISAFAQLPVYSMKTEGNITNVSNIISYSVVFVQELLQDKEYYYVEQKDNSMSALFPEGSLLLIEKKRTIESGSLHLIRYNNLYDIRRLNKEEGYIAVLAEPKNSMPSVKVLQSKEVEVIGKVAQITIK